MGPVFEGSANAEVAATAAQRPVKIRIIVRADATQFAIRSDDIHLENVIDRHAKAPAEAAESTTQGQPAYAGVRYGAGCSNQAMCHRLRNNFV